MTRTPGAPDAHARPTSRTVRRVVVLAAAGLVASVAWLAYLANRPSPTPAPTTVTAPVVAQAESAPASAPAGGARAPASEPARAVRRPLAPERPPALVQPPTALPPEAATPPASAAPSAAPLPPIVLPRPRAVSAIRHKFQHPGPPPRVRRLLQRPAAPEEPAE